MLKKKATSKTPKKRVHKMATTEDKPKTTTTSAPGGSVGAAQTATPVDPLQAIRDRNEAAKGGPSTKPVQEAKKPDFVPANLTGVEQMQVTTAGMQPGPAGPRDDKTAKDPTTK